jgi:CPA1 family monovalent cation:H+ antiporter
MRGVVTIAAAQTLPRDTPLRALLVLVAFLVAVGSLGIQGGTVAPLLRWLRPASGPTAADRAEERRQLDEVLEEATADVRASWAQSADAEGGPAFELAIIAAKRDALLVVRDLGTFSSAALEQELRRLDATQIRLEL